jgi:hypothetical protein
MKELRWDSNLTHTVRQTRTWSICYKAASWYTKTEMTEHNCSRGDLGVFPFLHNYYFCLFLFLLLVPLTQYFPFIFSSSFLLSINIFLSFLPLSLSLSFLSFLFYLYSYLSFSYFFPSSHRYFLISFFFFSYQSYFMSFCSPTCLCWYHI